MGVAGLWLGVASGALLQAVVIVCLVSRWDWRLEVQRVQRIMREEGGGAAGLAAAH
jgi:hypothetical protein